MSSPRYPEEFKKEAVKQVVDRQFKVADVASRIGISTHSLYAWIKRYGDTPASTDLQDENRRLKVELRRVTEERDILKKAAAYFAKTSG